MTKVINFGDFRVERERAGLYFCYANTALFNTIAKDEYLGAIERVGSKWNTSGMMFLDERYETLSEAVEFLKYQLS